MSAVNLRKLTEQFLEYMSGLYNASFDITDTEKLAQMIRARTDKVMMTAESCGVSICRHDRGSEIGDGRMDVDVSVTDIPENDGKIARCRNFGCTFSDDAAVEIPEKITVWKYVPETEADTGMMETEEENVQCPN